MIINRYNCKIEKFTHSSNKRIRVYLEWSENLRKISNKVFKSIFSNKNSNASNKESDATMEQNESKNNTNLTNYETNENVTTSETKVETSENVQPTSETVENLESTTSSPENIVATESAATTETVKDEQADREEDQDEKNDSPDEQPEQENTATSEEQHTYSELQTVMDRLVEITSKFNSEASSPQNELLENIQAQLEKIEQTQNDILASFDQKLKYDNHKEQIIDNLHRELQEYKEDLIKSAVQPIVRDLIMINDNILKLVDNFRASEEELDANVILTRMEEITLDIDDALYRQGIDTFTSDSDIVDPTRQKIFKTIKTNDASKEKQLAERMRKGYEWDDKIVRKELVTVYVYDENAEAEKSEDKE